MGMNVDDARALKAALLAEPLADHVAAATALPRAAMLIRGTPRPTKPESTVAIGLTQKGADVWLAVRVQQVTPGTESLVSYIRERAKGECDVRLVGRVVKQVPWHQKRNRPLRIGGSVGHPRVTAGTLGAFVTAHGGDGSEDLILSNNHVLANENDANKGDVILQPGKADGGRRTDAVGELHSFKPLKLRGNRIDAATAGLKEGVEYYFDWLEGLSSITGVRTTPLSIGEPVFKVGRTTGTTEGRIAAIEVDDLQVEYDRGDLVFDGQIEIAPVDDEPFSLGGDSGSLVVDADRMAVGLLFAGNDVDATYANPIADVLDGLKVDLVF
jgi:hypothetical protein